VRYPKAGRVNANVLPKLVAIASATSATSVFGPAFLTKYSIATTMAVADTTPPLLLTASKALTGVTGSPATISVADMFATNTGGTLTYGLASTTNPTPSNVSVNASTGLLTVRGRYLNRTYAANVSATSATGVASPQGTLSVTEVDAPAPTLTTALGTVSLTNNTVSYSLSNHFATAADTMPLYYWLTANPNANVSIGAGGLMSVAGASRGTSYNVSVSASNAYGKSAPTAATLSVTEAAAASQQAKTWASTTNPMVAWATSTTLQTFAIPANALSGITNPFQYSINGSVWNNFGAADTYFAVSGGVTHNGFTYSGYVQSSPWSRGNTNYTHRVARLGTFFTTSELTAIGNCTYPGPYT
jgi:hypothetical protein